MSLWGRGRVGKPMELALREPLMDVNIENVSQGENTRAGGYKKGNCIQDRECPSTPTEQSEICSLLYH